MSRSIQIDDLRRIYLLRLDPGQGQPLGELLAQLNADPEIEYAELNHIGFIHQIPNDPYFDKQWAWNNSGQSYPISGGRERTGTARADIDILSAWGTLGEPEPVVIAVLDSGVDYSHRDLQGSLWTNEAEREGQVGIDDDGNGWIDDIYGYDFVNDDGDPLDDNGHGTHCAGIIGAGIDNGLDIASICPNARIMAVKVMDASGEGTDFNAAKAIFYAVDHGAQVISCSWGFSEHSESVDQAVDYAIGQGVVVVASVGNADNEDVQYPAAHAQVIAVAATDANDRKASFSTYGAWVDISAPGTSILSLRAHGTDLYLTDEDHPPGHNFFPYGDPNATMYIASGTSMAGPMVAGVVGLMLSHFPDRGIDYIVDRLLMSADSLDSKNPDYSGLLGAGRLNAYKALRLGFEGSIRFERDLVNGHDTLEVVLLDFDLVGLDGQEVLLSSDGGDTESLLLRPTSDKAWVFRGTMATSTEMGTSHDGTLQVSNRTVITALYADADDGSGVQADVLAYARADTEAPLLLNVQVLTTGASPRIWVKTDEPTTVRVLCGSMCGGPYPIQESDLALALEHTVSLSGVLSDSDYVFVVELTDEAGNVTTSASEDSCHGFRTQPLGDVHVPGDYPTIQEAIDNAWDGSTVWITDGTYTGPGNRDIDFSGKAITVRSVNGPECCIIDCQSNETEQHRGFIFRNSETAQSVLQGLTITHGYRSYDDDDGFNGGAIACIGAGPTLRDCVIVANQAIGGAGLYSSYGSPIVENCRFQDNETIWGLLSRGPGAGAYCVGGRLSLSDCTFMGNAGGRGGGLYVWSLSSATMTNCTFEGNSVEGAGGGLHVRDVMKATLTDCTFGVNHADDRGGGLYIDSSNRDVALANCLFVGNTSFDDGTALCSDGDSGVLVRGCTFERNGLTSGDFYAAVCHWRGGPFPMRLEDCLIRDNHGTGMKTAIWGATELRNCRILDNRSDDDAGGIDCRECTVKATGCLIAGNRTGDAGGGIDSRNSVVVLDSCIVAGNRGQAGAILGWQGADMEIRNCSIVGNESTEKDSAIYLSSYDDRLRLVNSIARNDAPKEIAWLFTPRESIEVVHSNIRGGWDGPGNMDVDPLFVDTHSADPGDWDLHLSPGSPCIDVGLDCCTDEAPSMDMDNVIRSLDGDGDGTAQCDIGAFEFVPASDGPVMGVSASELRFYTYRGGPDPPVQRLCVSNAGRGLAHWSVEPDPACPWLRLDCGNGSVQGGEIDETKVRVSGADMEVGDYTCALSISADETPREPITVIVRLHVTEPLHVPAQFPTIQSALDAVEFGGSVIVAPGTYTEALVFPGYDLTLRSVNPDDPNVVAATVVSTDGLGRVVTLGGRETPACLLSGLTLAAGSTGERGGGIFGNGSKATITHCVVRDCEARYGGGIADCDGLISNCHIINNITNDRDHDGHGGGLLYCDGAIESCVIQGNRAQEGGGGLSECHASIVNCLIAHNKTPDGAGALYRCHGRIENCRIEANVSSYASGCLSHCNGDIINCLIVGNTGKEAKALFHCLGSIVHCTIADNTSLQPTTFILLCRGEITNCIILGDESDGVTYLFYASSTPSYSCFPGAEGQGNIDVDPGFVRPGYWDTNGTPENFNDDVWFPGDYRLTDGSGCIDSGASLPGCAISPTHDLDGRPRPLNGSLAGSPRADMGCYEFDPTPLGAPLIEVDTRTFTFTAGRGTNPSAGQSLMIHNAGDGALNWRLEENCPWLSVSPEAGLSSVDPVPVALTVQSQGLLPGQYETQLAIVAEGVNNSPYPVDVRLTVRGPRLGFAPKDFEFLATVGRGDPCEQTLCLHNHGATPLLWQVTSDRPWLTLDAADGQLGTEEGFRIRVGIDTDQLPCGTYTGHVTLQAQTDANGPHTIPVALYLADDEIHVPADHATIQQAIDAAQDGSVIVLADGRYTGPGNRGVDYHGKVIAVRSANGPERCIIDCEQQDRGFAFHSWEPPEAILEGVSIINGQPTKAAGGGIYCDGAAPTIRNCVIQYCQSTSGAGGGIYCADNENQVISNCVISHNTADGVYGGGGGGGIYVAATARWITIGRCTITHNRAVRREDATVDYYGKGGGLYYVGAYSGASFRGPLKNCLIAHNHADLDGGGVAIDGYPPQITNCTIAYNHAAEGVGGFHVSEDSYLPWTKDTLINSILWGNEPNDLSEDPDMLMSYCDIENGWSGQDNLGLDPLFVNPDEGDFHLKSQAGHWGLAEKRWITDPVTSPCIDAGDPDSDVADEPAPNGDRINLGAYGGTAEASRSP